MRHAAVGALLAAAILLARSAGAAITLELRVDAEVREGVTARIVVRNLGDEPAEGLVPVATLAEGRAQGAEPESLPPGFTASWDLALPRPPAVGIFPLVVELAYADAFGRASSVPAVHLVRTPGAGGSALEVTVDPPPPLVAAGTTTVRIVNRAARPAAGTLHVVASGDVAVTPVTRPIELAPGAATAATIDVTTRGGIAGSTAAVYAYVTVERGGRFDAAVGSTVVTIGDAVPEGRPVAPGLVLAAAALGVLGLLVAGRRWLGAAPAERSRAARRRAAR